MPINPGHPREAETTTRGSVVALRRDASPNPYVRQARGASPASDSPPPSAAGEEASAEEGSGDASETAPPKIASSHVVDAARPIDRGGEEGKGVREVTLPPIRSDLPLVERPGVALQMGHEAFTQTGYWISFYRAILGPEGVIHKLFPSAEQMEYFEGTAEFLELHKMLTALRTTDEAKIDAVEPQTMITVRLPRSLQAMLVEEARGHEVSTNKLCISKLLMPISPMFVPEEKGKIRGRKPGQQARYNRLKGSKSKRKS